MAEKLFDIISLLSEHPVCIMNSELPEIFSPKYWTRKYSVPIICYNSLQMKDN